MRVLVRLVVERGYQKYPDVFTHIGDLMLYHLALCLKPYLSFLNVIHYVSFRAIAALLSTLAFSFLFGDWFIEKSKLFFVQKLVSGRQNVTRKRMICQPWGVSLF
jgi:hypothetical protein